MRVSAVFTHSAQPRLARKNKSSTETSTADGEEMTGNSLTDCHPEESSDQQTEISSAAQIRTGGGRRVIPQVLTILCKRSGGKVR